MQTFLDSRHLVKEKLLHQHFEECDWTHHVCDRSKPQSLSDLAAKGCHVLQLDIMDEASMLAAVRSIEKLMKTPGHTAYATAAQSSAKLLALASDRYFASDVTRKISVQRF